MRNSTFSTSPAFMFGSATEVGSIITTGAGTAVSKVAVSTTSYWSWIVVGTTFHSTVTRLYWRKTSLTVITPGFTHIRPP